MNQGIPPTHTVPPVNVACVRCGDWYPLETVAEVYEGEEAELVRSVLGRVAHGRRILELCRMAETERMPKR